MAKAHISAWIEAEEKASIESAAKRITDSERGVTKLLQQFGEQVAEQLERLPQDAKLELDVRLVPRREA